MANLTFPEQAAASTRTEQQARAERRRRGLDAMRKRATAQGVPVSIIDEAENDTLAAFQIGDFITGMFGDRR